ncbi:hypothetical protein JCM8547_000316 [Rhodosporidiobolus lusitaniae]
MTPSLPVELVRHILELAAPIAYSPSFYLERRALLRACCLVSKTMCEIARPMLVQVYVADSPEDLVPLEITRDERKRGSDVKLLVVRRGLPFDDMGMRKCPALFALCPGVVELWLEGVSVVQLTSLGVLQGLRRLNICDGEVTQYRPVDGVLPSLEELSLSGIGLHDNFFDSFPSVATTPAIRVLGVSGNVDEDHETVFPSDLPLDVLEKLDILHVDVSDCTNVGRFRSPTSAKLVLDCALDFSGIDSISEHAPPFDTLRLWAVHTTLQARTTTPPSVDWELSPLAALAALIPLLPSSPFPSLRLLILPDILHPSSSLSDTLERLVRDLLRICAEKGVEVVFEPVVNWQTDSILSPAVLNRARRMRREREEGREE